MKRTVFLLIIAAGFAGRAATDTITVDGYAAIVNEHVITVSDVLEFILPREQQLRASYSGLELAQKRAEIFTNGVQQLVEQALILEEAKRLGATVPDRMVNDRINEIISNRFRNDRAAFLRTLADQQTTLDDWRDSIRDNMLVSILKRQEVFEKVRVTPAQIREAYDKQLARFTTTTKVKIRLIMLHKGATDTDRETKRKLAEDVRNQIAGGENFAELARKHSEDGTAANGGEWDWRNPADLREELTIAIAGLKPDETSTVLDVGDDYFIIRLEDRKEAGVQSLDAVRQTLEDEVKQFEGERLYSSWLERLKRRYHVQIFEVSPP